jgi:DNA-binding GntR family transcriptional regulator
MGRTLTDDIYELVKKDILQLRMKPGEKISEALLANRYSVSRAPIRSVIQRLQKEEFVQVKPQVGTLIMPISLQKARDILQIRLLLESHAAEVAARNITAKELSPLQANFERLKRKDLNEEERRTALFETDILLHQTIWKLCNNREIGQIINNYLEETTRIRLSTLELANRMVPSVEEMWAIFQALRKKAPQECKKAMRTHITNIMKAIEHVIRKTRAIPPGGTKTGIPETRTGY